MDSGGFDRFLCSTNELFHWLSTISGRVNMTNFSWISTNEPTYVLKDSSRPMVSQMALVKFMKMHRNLKDRFAVE